MTYKRRYYIYQGNRDTDVSLKEYFESQFNAMDKALSIAKRETEDKLAGFPLEYMRKGEYEKAHDQICAQVESVNKSVNRIELDIKNNIYPRLENKAMQIFVTVILTSVISGSFVALAAAFIKHLWP